MSNIDIIHFVTPSCLLITAALTLNTNEINVNSTWRVDAKVNTNLYSM